MARKGLQLAAAAVPVLISLKNREAQVSALSSILQGYRDTAILLLPLCPLEHQTPSRHRAKIIPSRRPGWGGCCFSGWGQLGHGLGPDISTASSAGASPLGGLGLTRGRATLSPSSFPLQCAGFSDVQDS